MFEVSARCSVETAEAANRVKVAVRWPDISSPQGSSPAMGSNCVREQVLHLSEVHAVPVASAVHIRWVHYHATLHVPADCASDSADAAY